VIEGSGIFGLHLSIDHTILTWILVAIGALWGSLAAAARARRERLVKALEKRNAELTGRFDDRMAMLEQAIDGAITRLSELKDQLEEVNEIATLDRQNQATRIKMEITRSFLSDISSGAKSHIYDFTAALLVQGQTVDSCHIGWLMPRASRKIRFISQTAIPSLEEVDFSATFRDDTHQYWRLVPGHEPERIEPTDAELEWVYREPQTDPEDG
jgi:hypothetical protein